MKFHEIAIGTRFEFEGETYTKSDTLLATSSSGTKRLIRRSAILKPLDFSADGCKATTSAPATLDRKKTLQAFEDFYRSSLDAGGNATLMEVARRRFLEALE